MANEQSIEEIISGQAFEQLDKLKKDLADSNKLFIDNVASVNQLNAAIGKSKTFSEFNKSADAAALATERLNKAQLLSQQQADKLSALQAKNAFDEEKRVNARIALEAKKTAELEKQTRTVVSNSQAEVDAYNKEATAIKGATDSLNEFNRAKASQDNTAASSPTGKAPSQAQSTIPASDLSVQEQALQSYIKTSIQLKIEIDQLKASQKSLDNQFKEGDITEAQLANQSSALAARLAVLGVALNENNAQVKAQAQNVASASGSYSELQARLSGLIVSFKAMSDAERNETGGKELQAQILSLTTQLKELDAGIGIHNRNVGNYGQAFSGLAGNISSLIPGVGTLTSAFQGGAGVLENLSSLTKLYFGDVTKITAAQNAYTKATEDAAIAKEALAAGTITAAEAEEAFATAQVAATAATEAGTIGLRVFKIALASTGIGAIIVALGALYTYFTQTQDGINKTIQVLEPLKVAFRLIVEGLEDFGKAILNVFSVKGILAFGQAIETNIINRFKGLAEIVKGIYHLDFKQTANGIIEVTTGIADGIDKTKAFIKTSVDLGSQIAKLKIERDAENATLDEQVSKLNLIARRQGEIARDSSKDRATRAAAAKAGIAAINQELALNNKYDTLRLKIVQLENSTRAKTNATINEESQIRKKINNDEAAAAQARIRLTSALNKANKTPKTAKEKVDTSDLDTQKAKLEAERNTQKAIADDENASFEERLAALGNFVKLSEQINAVEAATEIKRGKNVKAERAKQATEDQKGAIEAGQQLAKITKEAEQKRIKTLTAAEKDAIQVFKDETNEQLEEIELRRAQQSQAIAEQYAEGKITRKRYLSELDRIDNEAAAESIKVQIDAQQKIIDADKLYLAEGIGTNKQLGEDERKLAELRIKLSKLGTDAKIADLEKVAEAEKKQKDLLKNLALEVLDFGIELGEASFQRQTEALDAQAKAASDKKDQDIQNVEDSIATEDQKQQQIAIINARADNAQKALEERQAVVKQRQARFEKAASIAKIIASTASAEVEALTYLSNPFTAPLYPGIAATIAGIGLAQIATVLATPIPKYKDGVKSAPGGLAWVGDGFENELRIEPNGSVSMTPDVPTLTSLKPGTQIIGGAELKRMAKTGDYSNVNTDMKPVLKELKTLNRSIGGQKQYRTILTEKGLHNSAKSATGITKYLNRNFGN